VGVGKLATACCIVGDACAVGPGVDKDALVGWGEVLGVLVARGVAVWAIVGVGSRFVAVAVGGSGVVTVDVGGSRVGVGVGVYVAVAVGSICFGGLTGVGETSGGTVGLVVGTSVALTCGRQPVSRISYNNKMDNKTTQEKIEGSVGMIRAVGDFIASLFFLWRVDGRIPQILGFVK
jgi:hypothetical protein